jgi:hypothetical protein
MEQVPISERTEAANPWLERKTIKGLGKRDGSAPADAYDVDVMCGTQPEPDGDWPVFLLTFQPTDEELERLREGASVELRIYNSALPVHSLSVGSPTPRTDEPDPGLLTEAEHTIVTLLGRAASKFRIDVIGDSGELPVPGSVERDDLAEFVDKVHQLQHVVLAQAAARAYPNRYRSAGRVPE